MLLYEPRKDKEEWNDEVGQSEWGPWCRKTPSAQLTVRKEAAFESEWNQVRKIPTLNHIWLARLTFSYYN